jgi:hypothetical protein
MKRPTSRKRHRPEEVVVKLRQSDEALAKAVPIAEVARLRVVSELTLYRWRAEYDIGDRVVDTLQISERHACPGHRAARSAERRLRTLPGHAGGADACDGGREATPGTPVRDGPSAQRALEGWCTPDEEALAQRRPVRTAVAQETQATRKWHQRHRAPKGTSEEPGVEHGLHLGPQVR